MKTSHASRLLLTLAITVALVGAETFAQNAVPLYSFSYGADGGYPSNSTLVQGRDGALYGTTGGGGVNGGGGTVFRITLDGTLTTIYSFCSDVDFIYILFCNDGAGPTGLVLGSDGNFYGTTGGGGSYREQGEHHSGGTVFRITPAGNLTTLHSFKYDTDGRYPIFPPVEGSDGSFYGTTEQGGTISTGALGSGTVYRITPDGTFTTLHTFVGNPVHPQVNPGGLVLGRDGELYGTTGVGGGGCGTVYRITSGGSLTVLHSFNSIDACRPHPALVQADDGDFYGVASAGGATDRGTVFKVTSTGSVTTLHHFDIGGGYHPTGVLVQGPDRTLYGTTLLGGTLGVGTVFRLTPAGTFDTLYNFGYGYTFPESDGAFPRAGVVIAGDGHLYGTTFEGGVYDRGTVFRIALSVAPTTEDQCKNGGWASFTSPRTFVNQGDCMQYVNTGK